MKHLENEIIEYIGNEMDVEARLNFEERIKSNPELKTKVLAMQNTTESLHLWEDELIEIPSYEETKNSPSADVINQPVLARLPSWIRYAAVAAVVFGIFWMSGLQINQVGNSLSLSFGEPDMVNNLDQRMKSQVATAVSDYMQSYNVQFAAYQDKVDQNLKNINTSLNDFNQQYASENYQLRNSLMAESSTRYAKLEEMIRGIESEQRQDIEGSFASIVQYWDEQRSTDLFKIENAFNEVAAAINNQQDKTDAIFSSLSEPVAVTTNY